MVVPCGKCKRWKEGILQKEILHQDNKYKLLAENIKELGDGHFLIRFSWEPSNLTFSEVLEISGHVPLPPYISRGDSVVDTLQYQTIYARHEGSVAAANSRIALHGRSHGATSEEEHFL